MVGHRVVSMPEVFPTFWASSGRACQGWVTSSGLGPPAHKPPVVAILAVAPQHLAERPRPLLLLSRVRPQPGRVESTQAPTRLHHGGMELLIGADQRRVGTQLE